MPVDINIEPSEYITPAPLDIHFGSPFIFRADPVIFEDIKLESAAPESSDNTKFILYRIKDLFIKKISKGLIYIKTFTFKNKNNSKITIFENLVVTSFIDDSKQTVFFIQIPKYEGKTITLTFKLDEKTGKYIDMDPATIRFPFNFYENINQKLSKLKRDKFPSIDLKSIIAFLKQIELRK